MPSVERDGRPASDRPLRRGEDKGPVVVEFAFGIIGDGDSQPGNVFVEEVAAVRRRCDPPSHRLVEIVIAGADVFDRDCGPIAGTLETRLEAPLAWQHMAEPVRM